jgi:hypothetical protein
MTHWRPEIGGHRCAEKWEAMLSAAIDVTEADFGTIIVFSCSCG